VQALSARKLVVALRVEAGIARRATEHLQEAAGDAAVAQADGPLVRRNVGERLRIGLS